MTSDGEKRHPAKSAGSRMTAAVPTAKPSDTIHDVEHALAHKVNDFETVNYVYVLDGRRLAGVISIKEIFRSPKHAKLQEVMRTAIISVRPRTSLERAALLAVKNGIKAMPVTDKDGAFLGVVSADSLQEILHNEAVEDALLSAGIVHRGDGSAVALLTASPAVHFRRRIPWLLAGLLGGLLAAGIVTVFEHALEEEILLAAFIPMVVYLADAAGSQTQTLYIRSVALDAKLDLRAYAAREAAVVARLAAVLAVAIGVISLSWWRHAALGITLAVSVLLTMFVAAAVAVLLPWAFIRKGIDPAVASGPLATIIRDISALAIYFAVAAAVLAAFAT